MTLFLVRLNRSLRAVRPAGGEIEAPAHTSGKCQLGIRSSQLGLGSITTFGEYRAAGGFAQAVHQQQVNESPARVGTQPQQILTPSVQPVNTPWVMQ